MWFLCSVFLDEGWSHSWNVHCVWITLLSIYIYACPRTSPTHLWYTSGAPANVTSKCLIKVIQVYIITSPIAGVEDDDSPGKGIFKSPRRVGCNTLQCAGSDVWNFPRKAGIEFMNCLDSLLETRPFRCLHLLLKHENVSTSRLCSPSHMKFDRMLRFSHVKKKKNREQGPWILRLPESFVKNCTKLGQYVTNLQTNKQAQF